jgi:hypothetical protein
LWALHLLNLPCLLVVVPDLLWLHFHLVTNFSKGNHVCGVALFAPLFLLQEVNTIDDAKEVLKGFHALFLVSQSNIRI